jgi:hypothetical protein
MYKSIARVAVAAVAAAAFERAGVSGAGAARAATWGRAASKAFHSDRV